MSRVAIVLFNLGGPDGPEAVRPFLFNLFNDPAIIGAPGPIRWLLAQLISRRRAPIAREIYENLGGGSPLVPNTMAQAEALQAVLSEKLANRETRVFVSMRYWHPMSDEVAREVAAWQPDEILLLPLYPQFSTTTSGSSVGDWVRAARKARLDVPTRTVCCWPVQSGFIGTVADLTRKTLDEVDAGSETGARVLFSAHGLPKKIVDKGDPYQWQVEQTCAAIARELGLAADEWVICYQSRVGPLEWIGPSTDAEIARAGADDVPVVVVPVAFISEHSETLVELDIEYRQLAGEKGVPGYHRVPTAGVGGRFIEGLAEVAMGALARSGALAADGGERICPSGWSGCPMTSQDG